MTSIPTSATRCFPVEFMKESGFLDNVPSDVVQSLDDDQEVDVDIYHEKNCQTFSWRLDGKKYELSMKYHDDEISQIEAFYDKTIMMMIEFRRKLWLKQELQKDDEKE